MNQATITGRLAQNPDMTTIPETGTLVAKFTLAVEGSRKDRDNPGRYKTEWIDCAAFKKQAEIAEKYLTKGRKILVQGDINTDKYEDRDGNRRSKTYISVYKIEFLERNPDQNGPERTRTDQNGPESGINIPGEASALPQPGAYNSMTNNPGPAQDFEEYAGNDDDLPF